MIYAGDLARAFRFDYPTRGPRVDRLNGVFDRATTLAVFIGTYTWNGKRGTVVLAPGYPGGGEHGDHLIFRWRQSGSELALSIHAWEPLAQTFATLRAMIDSI